MSRVPSSSHQGRTGFFQKQDPWGHGLAIWVLALLLFLAPLGVSSLRHLRLKNDVENWLPENDPSAVDYLQCREYFPENDKILLTWEGSTPNDARIPILVGKLQGQIDPDGQRRGGLPYVESVVHAGDLLNKMIAQGVSQEVAVQRLRGTFLGSGRLKVQLTEAGRADKSKTTKALIERARQELGLTLTVHDPALTWAPKILDEAHFDKLLSEYERAAQEETPRFELALHEHDLQLSWPGMSADVELQQTVMQMAKNLRSFATADEPQGRRLVADCFSAVGTPMAMVVTLSEAGAADKNRSISAIRRAAIESLIPDDGLIVGGRVVAAAELNNGVIRAAWNPAGERVWEKSVIGLSGLVGILFALISLRSIRLGLLVVGISYYAALLGLTMIPLTGGSMNMVLIVMPTLLMVLALSGAIHVANYWKHAAWENPRTAVAEATRMASQPCLMAAFTTSLGLISLMNSDLVPVREFGFYASIGCLISVVMVLYGLPSLLQMIPLRRVAPEEIRPQRWLRYGEILERRWRVIGVCSVLAALVCTCGLSRFDVETKVIRYFPESSRVVKDYQTIEDNLAGISPIEILVRFNQQSQSDLRFLERLELIRRIEAKLQNHPEVTGSLSLATFMPERESPAADASTREKIFFNRRSNETEKRIKHEFAHESRDFLVTTPATERGSVELWRINAQAKVLSDADYNDLTEELSQAVAEFTRYHAGVDHVVTGTVPLFLRTQKAVLESLIWSSLLAFGLIATVMIWVLKDPLAGLFSMIPNVLPVLSVFGLVSWFGQKIDIGTMVTASVAMGIAVDGTLHLLTWFRNGLERGLPRQESVRQALLHCGPAMWQTSAAVGLGLLILFPAELLLISRFGWLMALLIGGAFIGDMVLLPCLLIGPLGALIERNIRSQQAEQTENIDLVPVSDPATDSQSSIIPAPHIPLAASKTARVAEPQ